MPKANRIAHKFDSGRLKYISGQVDAAGREDGICRVEWAAGDMYEGQI